jgi:lantibiotic modifying enzyme
MDGWLDENLEDPDQNRAFDLIEGLTGAGLYALARASRPQGADLIARVLSRLESARVPTPQGKAWFTPPEQLHEHQREEAPQGYFNLGLSHGAAGVVAFLARALEAPQCSGQARGLLDEAVPWLLAQRGTGGNVSCFPSWAGPGLALRPSRLAWCYGDLGIATALLAAGRATGNQGWVAEALAIARHSAGRPEEGSGVRDVALCHGAAGVSLAFSRFFQVTGEPCFREAARLWLLWALAKYRPGEEVAGFPLWVPRRSQDHPRLPQLGLLEGVAGLGLVLLSALHSVEPGWDRMLLLS